MAATVHVHDENDEHKHPTTIWSVDRFWFAINMDHMEILTDKKTYETLCICYCVRIICSDLLP